MAIWRRVAWWISKATRAQACASDCAPPSPHPYTHTHTYTHRNMQDVLLFSRQHVFRKRASMLRYTYIVLPDNGLQKRPKHIAVIIRDKDIIMFDGKNIS
jgi:hypothetical protein